MPEANSITVAYSRKVQLDDFEPIECHAEVNVSLDGDDSLEDVYDEYADRAEDLVEQQIAARVTAKQLEADDD